MGSRNILSRTFQRMQPECVYSEEINEESYGEMDSDTNMLIIEEIDTENAPYYEHDLSEQRNEEHLDETPQENVEESEFSGRDIWLEAPTKLLLSSLEHLLPKVGKTYALKNKTKMWKQIQKTLSEKGYSFTVAQVQGKFRSLERRYKQTKLHNAKTGRNKITCPYESELDKILGDKRGLHPECVLDSNDAVGSSRDDVGAVGLSNASISSNAGVDDLDIPPLGRRKTTSSLLLKKIDDMEDTKKEYQNHKMDFNRKILEAIIEKNRIERDRNVILQRLVKKCNSK